MLSPSQRGRNTSHAFLTEIHTNCRDNTRGRRSRLVRQRGWQPVLAAGCRLSSWVASRSAGIAAGTPTVRDDPPRHASRVLVRGPHRQKLSRRPRLGPERFVGRRLSAELRNVDPHTNVPDLNTFHRATSTIYFPMWFSAAHRDCAVDHVTLWALFHARPEKNSTGGTTGAGVVWTPVAARKFSPRRPAHRAKVARRAK